MYIQLHTHSYYSFLAGLDSPAALARQAADAGMPAIALTDHGWMTGAIEFYDACFDEGVKPIIGLEIPFTHLSQTKGPEEIQSSMILLAMDSEGWKNISRLSSSLQTDPEISHHGAISMDLIAKGSGGVICIPVGLYKPGQTTDSPSNQDLMTQLVAQFRDIYPERLYIPLQRSTPGDKRTSAVLNTIAVRMGLPVVAIHPVYYISPGGEELQRVVTAIRLNTPINRVNAKDCAPADAHFITDNQANTMFYDQPEAIKATMEIAERCQLDLALGKPRYPVLPLPPGTTPDDVLIAKAVSGARKLYGQISSTIEARLNHELEVIAEKGFAPLFLIMEDILNFTRQADIPTASRGSAASSLVAHCLGITTPDPLRLNLYFERFLNPARSSPPDIDTDICSQRRDEVIQHVYETYGHEKVAMVATVNRFRERSALRETAKAYGLPQDRIRQLVDALPRRSWGPPQRTHSRSESPYSALEQRFSSPHYAKIFTIAAALLDKPHHLSIHPGGAVIAPQCLTEITPTHLASKGIVITQMDLASIERLGLVKIDLLGIRGLSVLGDVALSMQGKQPQEYKSRLAALDAIPRDDPSTSELLRNGKTIGCFQIESPGMRATLREIKASNVDDITITLALYRPGPLRGGLKDAFVRRHLGIEEVEHLHPAFAELLADTYGVILYQEQVLRIAHELAGLSLSEADLLRRAMSHFDPGKQMQTLKEKFIAGAQSHRQIPLETSERVWEMMAAFAGYGFPKAHAASYAQISWRSAWCKAHFPAEFLAAILANWGGYYSQRVYLMEARRLQLPVKGPHVNYSQHEFCVDSHTRTPTLYMGLNQVRDLTRRTQTRIIKERPFPSLNDFLVRVDPRTSEAENLAKCGALRDFGSVPELLEQLGGRSWQSHQYQLFSMPNAPSPDRDWGPEQIVSAQEYILGISVDFHPLELVARTLTEQGVITSSEAVMRVGKRVRVAGMRETLRKITRSSGEVNYRMILEDLDGNLPVIITKTVYHHHRNLLQGRGPFIVEGVVEVNAAREQPYLRLEKIWPAR